jgi:hypothetical protein
MITHRQIICLILSALLLSSCSLLGTDTPQRSVRVKVLADLPFRARNPGWANEARGLIEAASDYYEREFDIRLVTQNVSPWPENERIASTPTLLAKLQKEFPLRSKDNSYDLIVVFTGENASRYLAARRQVDRIGNCAPGLAVTSSYPSARCFTTKGRVKNRVRCH